MRTLSITWRQRPLLVLVFLLAFVIVPLGTTATDRGKSSAESRTLMDSGEGATDSDSFSRRGKDQPEQSPGNLQGPSVGRFVGEHGRGLGSSGPFPTERASN